ncbi:MAG TPA: zf-HC2 domain-containing protein, partial [Clostridia bacterium]|nr:zf-HC2 domain-containing protein [Clostridia bacterium]
MTARSMSHSQLVRLAVAALDFELTGAERGLLDAHLPGCAECRSIMARSRADAAAVAAIALVPAPPRVRAAVLDRAARTPARRPAWNLVLVAALLAALLAGLALGAGALLQLRNEGRSPISWQAAPVQASIAGDAASLAIEQVIAGNGLVLAAGRQSGGTLLLGSRDGRTWTAVGDAPANATAFAFVSVGPRADQFAALGETAAGLPAVWWSSDGAAWTEEIVDDAPGSVTGLETVDDTIALAGYHRVLSSTELPEDTRRPAVWRLRADGWESVAMAGVAEGDGAPGLLLDSPR